VTHSPPREGIARWKAFLAFAEGFQPLEPRRASNDDHHRIVIIVVMIWRQHWNRRQLWNPGNMWNPYDHDMMMIVFEATVEPARRGYDYLMCIKVSLY
jgi:hypothetical protein